MQVCEEISKFNITEKTKDKVCPERMKVEGTSILYIIIIIS